MSKKTKLTNKTAYVCVSLRLGVCSKITRPLPLCPEEDQSSHKRITHTPRLSQRMEEENKSKSAALGE